MKTILSVLFCIICILLDSGIAYSQNADSLNAELYRIAQDEALNKNSPAKAITLAKQVLKTNPDDLEVRIFLGRLYAGIGTLDSARLQFNYVLKADPKNRDALSYSYDLEYSNDNFGFSLNHAQAALKYYPDSEEFVLKKAKALHSLGNKNEALKVVLNYLARYPESRAALAFKYELMPSTIIDTAQVNAGAKKPVEAAENSVGQRRDGKISNRTGLINENTAASLKLGILTDTLTSDGLLQAAKVEAFERKDYSAAINYLKRALERSPDYTDVKLFLGRIYTWTDQVNNARIQFNDVLAQDPSHAEALSASFDLEYWNNSPAAALKIAETGLTYFPASEEFTLKKAKALKELSRFADARQTLTAFLEKDPQNTAARELLLTTNQESLTTKASTATVGPDSLFTLARTAAFNNKNYPDAISLAQQSLTAREDDEVRIFLGRLYTWSDKPDSARVEFQQVLRRNPQHQEALSAIYDVELWNDMPASALKYAEAGIFYYPDNEDFTAKKIKALIALQKLKNAEDFADQYLQKHPQSQLILAVRKSIKDDNPQNTLSAGHTFVHFDRRFDKPWFLTSVSYGHKVKFGSINIGLNHANRFNQQGLEAELETYISIAEGLYSYVGGAFSGSGIFSNHRIGVSVYKSLPLSFEAEAGVRYLQFTEATFVYVVGIGKYVGNNFFSIKSYLTPGSTHSLSASLNASARFYTGEDRFDSFGISLGTGTSPDDRARRVLIENNLKSVKAGLDYSVNIMKRTTLAVGFSWANEEFQTERFGNQYSFGVSLSHRF